jgi:drug/metabolite transporter (DMT)-like permease
MENKYHNSRGGLLLLVTALVWGVAFVVQKWGTQHVGPFTFIATRSLIAAVVLMPSFFIKMPKLDNPSDKGKKLTKTLVTAGVICGCLFFASTFFQQLGLRQTSVGKAGFITALYMVIVPIIRFFMKKKTSALVWVSVSVALIGLYLMCINEDFTISYGDILIFMCALALSVHFIVVGHFSPKVNSLGLTCLQFTVVSIISLVFMFVIEKPSIESIVNILWAAAYLGVLSGALGCSMQIMAQRYTDPTIAALILSMESVFSMLAGWVILGEILKTKEIIGCLLVFAAIIMSQLPSKKALKANETEQIHEAEQILVK